MQTTQCYINETPDEAPSHVEKKHSQECSEAPDLRLWVDLFSSHLLAHHTLNLAKWEKKWHHFFRLNKSLQTLMALFCELSGKTTHFSIFYAFKYNLRGLNHFKGSRFSHNIHHITCKQYLHVYACSYKLLIIYWTSFSVSKWILWQYSAIFFCTLSIVLFLSTASLSVSHTKAVERIYFVRPKGSCNEQQHLQVIVWSLHGSYTEKQFLS